jgi:hypothetical protein
MAASIGVNEWQDDELPVRTWPVAMTDASAALIASRSLVSIAAKRRSVGVGADINTVYFNLGLLQTGGAMVKRINHEGRFGGGEHFEAAR